LWLLKNKIRSDPKLLARKRLWKERQTEMLKEGYITEEQYRETLKMFGFTDEEIEENIRKALLRSSKRRGRLKR